MYNHISSKYDLEIGYRDSYYYKPGKGKCFGLMLPILD